MFPVLHVLALLSSILLIYSLLSFFININPENISCQSDSTAECQDSLFKCGDSINSSLILNSPFRFEADPTFCNYPHFDLSCRHNRPVLQISEYYYYGVDVDSINYEDQTLRVIDPGIQKNNCSTLPVYWFDGSSYFELLHSSTDYLPKWLFLYYKHNLDALAFVRCENEVKSESKSKFHRLLDTESCKFSETSNGDHDHQNSSFNYVGRNLRVSDIEGSCTIIKIVAAQIDDESFLKGTGTGEDDVSFQNIHNLLADGFQLHWTWNNTRSSQRKPILCHSRSVLDVLKRISVSIHQRFSRISHLEAMGLLVLVLVSTARNVVGILLLIAFLIYKRYRRHLSVYDTIEDFLQANNGLMPIRYSYREIKSMTNNFKERLGEGGYGCVYKGTLQSGSFVAVKMLNKPKADGQEFINEVATIGRIHHVNVVRLVGFCVTSSVRALVYDYMPNGSLDKYIFADSVNAGSLGWKKAYEIAMGVARGIEYLHQGCNMRILHFDIKPHNILLDENLVPKVSDFGLAKLYPTQDGYIATLTAIRGTIGYIAPELIYKNIGRVSYKADVYSFGMLLMDMVGRWRNVDPNADRSSQMYFTSWIYDKFDRREDIEIGDDATDEEKGITKKLVLIALWCIQMTPMDRPSMREVMDMLEGDLDALQLPPKPLLYPSDSSVQIHSSSSSSQESTEPLCKSVTLEIEQIDT